MKNLQELLVDIDESVLDDDILTQYSPTNMTDKIKDILLHEYPKDIPGCDAYGRTLEIGDWVFCIPTGQKGLPRQTFGVIIKITPKRLTVGIGFDPDNMGFQRRRNFIFTNEYPDTMNISVPCTAVIKIDNKEKFISTLQ